MYWIIINVVIIMVNPLTIAKCFLASLRKECNIKFNKGLTKTTIDKTKSTKKAIKILEADKRDRDLFRKFYKDVVLSECKALEWQCTLVDRAVAHLNTNEIPFDKVEVTCEKYGQVNQLPVPKNIYEREIGEADIPQRLRNGELDYLHQSTLSALLIDQLGC